MLPISSRNGESIPLMTALFTATSATCVTGLTVVDTAQTWSVFGRATILAMFQIGGLGFMSITMVFFFVLHKKISISQRLLIMNSWSLRDIQGVVKLLRHVLFGTLVFQGIGTIILWIRFAPKYGVINGLGRGAFHSVSAFCNAGFDLMGYDEPFSSLTAYAEDTIVSITMILLVVAGGLGFFVWEDIWRNRNFKKLHLHSKMVLTISGLLILAGWVFFFFAERHNLETIGSMSLQQGVLVSLFQSVMPRSGGLSVVNQMSFTGASRMVILLLMLIGGSAGSTAGGIKNVTAGLLFLSAVQSLRGKSKLSVFGRTIPQQQIASALSVLVFVFFASFIGSVAIALIQPDLPFFGVVFEVVSAVATCGLSQGITHNLTDVSMGIIMVLMFLGRVGIITIGIAAFLRRNNEEKIKHPDTWVMM